MGRRSGRRDAREGPRRGARRCWRRRAARACATRASLALAGCAREPAENVRRGGRGLREGGRRRPQGPRLALERRAASRGEDSRRPRRARSATSRPRSSRRRRTRFCSRAIFECAAGVRRPARASPRRSGSPARSRRMRAPTPKLEKYRRGGEGRARGRRRRTPRSLKFRIVENLLRTTPRYQQARHDVEPGVLGLPARGLDARRSRRRLRVAAARRSGDASSRDRPRALGSSTGSPPSAPAAGRRDLVFAGARGHRRRARRADGFRAGRAAAGVGRAATLAVADVTNSGELDLVTPGALWVAGKATASEDVAAAGRARPAVRLRLRRRPRPLRLVERAATGCCATTWTARGPT